MDISARRPGQVVGGRYALIEQIGAGGMAEVWKAWDRLGPAHGEPGALYCAIKFVSKTLLRQSSLRKQTLDRFVRELGASMRFRHDHIVRVVDAGSGVDSYGIPYYVMDFVDGHTLDQDIRIMTQASRNPPIHSGYALKDLYRLMDQLLSALEYLHGEGVIHRDIKPQNTMIVRPERLPPSLKLLDLGIAKISPALLQETGGALTLDHQVVGTPSYMALEACGPVTDARNKVWGIGPYTDLYGVDVIWYEAVTGRLPYPGSSIAERQQRLLNPAEPLPDPGRLVKDLNPRLREVIMKGLSPFPWERHQTAHEMREAFRWAEEQEPWVRHSHVTPVHSFSIFTGSGTSTNAPDAISSHPTVQQHPPGLFNRWSVKKRAAFGGAVILAALVVAFRPQHGERSKKHASPDTVSIVPVVHAEQNPIRVIPVPSATSNQGSRSTGISPEAVIALGDKMVRRGKRNCRNAIPVYRVALEQTSDSQLIQRIQKKIDACSRPLAAKKVKRGHPLRSPRKR